MSSQTNVIEDAAQALLQREIDQKMSSVRELTKTRHAVLEMERKLAEERRKDAQAYAAALRGGWTEDSLKKIGLEKLGNSPRPARVGARKSPARGTVVQPGNTGSPDTRDELNAVTTSGETEPARL